jgi:hypothetical protein
MSAIRKFERPASTKPAYGRHRCCPARYVAFPDGNALNFLIADVRARAYIENVEHELENTMLLSLLVVGCSEQLPNQLRAYHVTGTSSAGRLLLSRHGVKYSAAADEVSSYRDLLERMLGTVLANLPASLRDSARARLTKRWNRDWGVNAEDLEGHRNGPVAAN